MGSIVCSQCGRVRWDQSARCPGCGAAGRPTEPGASLVGALTGVGTGPGLAEPWRARGDPGWWRSRNGRRLLTEAMAVTVVLLVITAVYAYEAGDFRAPPPPPQVLVPDHGTWPHPGGAGDYGWGFSASIRGTLEGGFRSANGSIDVCVSTFDPFWPTPTNPHPETCPSNATYSSGFVDAGHVSAPVNAGVNWIAVVPGPSYNESYPNWTVTWSPALEIVPA